MIPVYQHIVRSHIGRERANAEPIHLPSSTQQPLAWRPRLYCLLASHPLQPCESRGLALEEKRQTVITVDQLSTASGPSADLLHPFSHLQQKAGIWNPHDLNKVVNILTGNPKKLAFLHWNELHHSNGYHSLCTKLCSEVLIKKHTCVNVVF